MIIWGSRGKTKEISSGQFYCPRCRALRKYKRKEVARYFTLYFIPIFKTSTVGEYVECQVCFTPFEVKVLDYNPLFNEQIQEFLRSINELIEAGLTMNAIYGELINTGADKDTANMIISIATNGKMKTCNKCKLIYSGTLDFCSNCGNGLIAI